MAAYEDIGRKLREARKQRRLELHDVAQKLHIRQTYLESLEQGTLEQLPGDVFVHGYLSRYAWYLDLDPDEMLAEYRTIGTLPQRRLLYIPDSMREWQHPGWHVVVGTLCMAAILMLCWSAGMRSAGQEEKMAVPQASPVSVVSLPPAVTQCQTVQESLWPPCYYAMEKKPRGIMDLQ